MEGSLYKSYTVVTEMLKDRGYTQWYHTDPSDRKKLLNKSMDETLSVIYFNAVIKIKDYKIIFQKENDTELQLFFVIVESSNADAQNLGKKTFSAYKKQIEANKVDAAILVLSGCKLTSHTKKDILLMKPSVNVECWDLQKLQYNVTKHKIVPKHTLLTDEEKETFLQKYSSCKLDKLPKISAEDPVSLYYAAEVGQIFKIEKKSESSGNYISYRVVG